MINTDRVQEELARALRVLVQFAENRGEIYTPDQLFDIQAELEGFFYAGRDYAEWGDEAFD